MATDVYSSTMSFTLDLHDASDMSMFPEISPYLKNNLFGDLDPDDLPDPDGLEIYDEDVQDDEPDFGPSPPTPVEESNQSAAEDLDLAVAAIEVIICAN
jgi:hypothetical protein